MNLPYIFYLKRERMRLNAQSWRYFWMDGHTIMAEACLRMAKLLRDESHRIAERAKDAAARFKGVES